ncbi:hypothetical protein IIA79_04830 [bacterium]|nr:hypothetical protein [bacterium]
MLLFGADPPEPVEPPAAERTFSVRGAALTIQPGEETTYLRFSDGVTCSAQDFTLSADVVELRMLTGGATGGQALKLPKVAEPRENVVRDPGRIAAEMARELELPEARFSRSAIQHIAATGSVTVQARGVTFTTPELISTDGGRSWAALGRSTLAYSNKDNDEEYQLSAGHLLYDTESQRVLARGAIEGSFRHGGDPPIHMEAERMEMDVAQSKLAVQGYLLLHYKTLVLVCGAPTGAEQGQAPLADGARPPAEGAGLNAQLSSDSSSVSVSVDLLEQVVHAQGGVFLQDSELGITLSAGELIVDLRGMVLEASDGPELTYRGSVFKGTAITIRQEEQKTVIEVEGPQSARLNLETLDGPVP